MVAIKKAPFDKTTATDSNGQPIQLQSGRLTAAPHNFDGATHAKLNRKDFANRVVFLQHQLLEFDRENERRLKRRVELIGEIKEARDGVPSEAKLRARMDALRAEAAKIESQLTGQG